MFTAKKTYYILFFDILFTVLCSVGIYHIIKKSDLPFNFTFEKNGILVQEFNDSSDILITKIDDYRINNQDELEMILDSKSPGENVELMYKTNEKVYKSTVTLINFYSNFYIVTCAFLTFIFILTGVIVYLKKPTENYALIFQWLCLGVAGIIALTWGNYNIGLLGAGKAARVGFHLSYTFTPVLFLHFAFTFPRKIDFLRRFALTTAYSLAVVLFITGTILFWGFYLNQSETLLKKYLLVFDLYRINVIVCVLTSILVFIHSFKTSPYKSEKQKLLWLILGFIIGPGSFIVLWAIPQLLSVPNLVPEEIILIMITAIPITFAIAILKYRLMDIEFVITRGFVYSFTLALLYSFYLLLIYILSELTNSLVQPQNIISIISFGAAALFFHPLRLKVEKFIDKKFYGIRYNFRETFKNIVQEIKDINSIPLLSEIIVKRINELIVINKIGFFIYNPQENKMSLFSQKGFEEYSGKTFKIDNHLILIKQPAAHPGKIEQGIFLPKIESNFLKELNADIVFPLSTEKEFYGILVLGFKLSGLKYTIEDIDLIESIASRATSTVERIKLQENIIRNRLEMEKLDELNQMKSFFVSSVSHDLKTPLTSIKMFTDFLKGNNLETLKREEYLKIIEGETDRLTRLIDNVLDLTKIEKNLKEYQFTEIELNQVVQEVLAIMEYQISMSGFRVTKSLSSNPLNIIVDKDSVIRSIINLINNAIKFSGVLKEISISTFNKNGFCCVEVKDYGVGMDNSEIEKIFDPYYSSKEKFARKFQGTGLGLTIVKHTMDAHKGLVSVCAEKGKGSIFTLKFPEIKL